ncbi:hypothetical protein CRU99_10770 [Malaciobacter mytili]|uniref:hypothetical protein n=1 Tax=Malaciobacter mytili TaxID=603050 RepID=UPI00100A5506|nr:hypothetical protein [Malaciobacter mytili]RXI39505.1 hypothetical protein CRU99_10770 [Malaciobacter mytili]
MNIEKLKDLQEEFLEVYPKAFEDEKLLPIMKKFNPCKLEELSKEAFSKQKFSTPEIICEDFLKIIFKSVVISLYDKLKLRDAIKAMNIYEKDMFSIALYDLLYKNKKQGMNDLVEILAPHKLAKWTIISIIPYYLNRQKEYFIKPTTTKSIIEYLEIENLVYKPKPSYEFYVNYKKVLDTLKPTVNKALKKDNVCFTAFIRMGIEICND